MNLPNFFTIEYAGGGRILADWSGDPEAVRPEPVRDLARAIEKTKRIAITRDKTVELYNNGKLIGEATGLGNYFPR